MTKLEELNHMFAVYCTAVQSAADVRKSLLDAERQAHEASKSLLDVERCMYEAVQATNTAQNHYDAALQDLQKEVRND
jgi:hypothetical protein